MAPAGRVWTRGAAFAATAAALQVQAAAVVPIALHSAERHVDSSSQGDQTQHDRVGNDASRSQLQKDLLRGWLDHVQNMPLHLMNEVAAEPVPNRYDYKFETKWFHQNVDHVNKQHSGKFWQRYFVYSKFSRMEQNFPMFVFCGAEQGDIYLEWQRFGFMLDVAREHGAKVLYLEHRFFGASMPFGTQAFQLRSDRIGLLSLEQSVSDYAAIVRAERGEGPILTFGGSLSGTIAAMMRVELPTLVDMAFASSAPVLGVVGVADQYAWRKRLTDNFAELGGKDCPALVRRAFAAFARSPRDHAKLHQAFRPCEAKVSDAQWDVILGMAWQELERLGVFPYPANRSGIPLACEEMRAADITSDEQLFARMLHLGPGGRIPQKCLNLTRLSAPPPSVSWADGWSYMACTEVVHPIGANNVTDMFPPYNWTVEGLKAGCQQAWGVTPDAAYLRHKLNVPVETAGAHPRTRRTTAVPGRILFSYGTRDPWSTMVPRTGWSDDVEIVPVPGGGHCSDLETPRLEDSAEMRAARGRIAGVIRRWLAEVRPLRRMKLRGFGKGAPAPGGLDLPPAAAPDSGHAAAS